MITALREIVSSVFTRFHGDDTPKIDLDADNLAVFCGEAEPYDDGTLCFWIAHPSMPGMPFPDTASDPETIEALRQMELGQVFGFLEEESAGQLSTRFKGIEVEEHFPIIDVPDMTDPNTILAPASGAAMTIDGFHR